MFENNQQQKGKGGASVFWSPFLFPIYVVFTYVWFATISLVVIDPLDLYSWGRPPKLTPNYPPRAENYFYSVASRADVDALLLGGSTFSGITNDLIVDAFGDSDTAFNFSISGPRPADRILLFDMVERNSSAMHIIIGLDWIFALPLDAPDRKRLPLYLYDESVVNDLRLASPQVFAMTALNFVGLQLPGIGWNYEKTARKKAHLFEQFQSQESLADTVSSILDNPLMPEQTTGPAACDQYPLVTETLVPFAQRMAKKGRKVDIVIPPYALGLYRVWDQKLPDAMVADRKPFLGTQIAMRRCTVMLVDNIAGVKVFAFDNQTEITGDLSNYRDLGHVYNLDVFNQIIRSVSQGNHVLNIETIDEYTKHLIYNVKNLYSNDNKHYDREPQK